MPKTGPKREAETSGLSPLSENPGAQKQPVGGPRENLTAELLASRGPEEPSVRIEIAEAVAAVPESATAQAALFQQERDDEVYPGSRLLHTHLWPGDDASTTSTEHAAAAVDETAVPFAYLSDVLADISSTGSRLETQRMLAECFYSVMLRAPGELVNVVYLTINKLAPAHEGQELGIGDALLMKIVAGACGSTVPLVREQYRKLGDLAEVAQLQKGKMRALVRPAPLTCRGVLRTFRAMAATSGNEAQRRRCDLAQSLLRAATRGPEVNFLVRGLQGKMRIGVAEATILSAVGYAAVLRHLGISNVRGMTADDLQRWLVFASEGVTRAFHEVPSFDVVVGAVLHGGLGTLLPGRCAALQLQPGLPVKPMLAHPTTGVAQILQRFSGKHFTCEYKYDGERCQVHFVASDSAASTPESVNSILQRAGITPFSPPRDDESAAAQGRDENQVVPTLVQAAPSISEIKVVDALSEIAVAATEKANFSIFSRNSESHTEKYPDVIAGLPAAFNPRVVRSFILDSEVVAVDPETGALKPFQSLQHRGRKNIRASDVTVPVCLFAFDLLFLNGESLLERPLRERRAALRACFRPSSHLRYASALDSDDVEALEGFLTTSIADGCEGLMVKTLDVDARYTPFRRSYHWLKLKKDYMDGAGDTLDLVPIGAYSGKGKRTGVYGGFLLACYDPQSEQLQSICKIGTGFSDQDLETISNAAVEIPRPPPYYRSNDAHTPDVWLDDTMVWEVKCADLTVSPTHYAAMGRVAEGRGVALRFPRYIRMRDDKSPVDATSAEQVAVMYKAQALAVQQAEAEALKDVA